MSDQIAIDNYKLYIATNSVDEVADLLVNQDKVIAGLTKNNSDFVKQYRETTSDLARLRELLGEALERIPHWQRCAVFNNPEEQCDCERSDIQSRIQSELKE